MNLNWNFSGQKCLSLFLCSLSMMAIAGDILKELIASTAIPHVFRAPRSNDRQYSLLLWEVVWDVHIFVPVMFVGQ